MGDIIDKVEYFFCILLKFIIFWIKKNNIIVYSVYCNCLYSILLEI